MDRADVVAIACAVGVASVLILVFSAPVWAGALGAIVVLHLDGAR